MDSADSEAGGSHSGSTVKRHFLTPQERIMVKNVYEGLRVKYPYMSAKDCAEFCGFLTKVSARTVFRVLGGVEKPTTNKQENRGRKKIILDDDVKYAIRRKLHGFFYKNEIPNLKKLQAEISKDDSLPNISREVLIRTLRQMNIRYLKRNRKSMLIERDEIVLWRRRYLEDIRKYRAAGRKIYYTDETWLNEGHTVSKVWQDLNVTNSRQAFLDGFSTGLKCPSGKGRRLIITHIGSDSGFLHGGLNMFESRKTGDYHEDMTAEVFEKWFSETLTLIEPGSVIVLDNAPYHSRQIEKLPTSAWRKEKIIEWLQSKNLQFDAHMLKLQLLDIARQHKKQYLKYAVDEMARNSGVTVLRLPPYHCELNPIELIWAQIKGEVGRKNTTFKLNEVKVLLGEAIAGITAEEWWKCVEHVKKDEEKMWNLDSQIEVVVEPVNICLKDSSSESESDFSEPSDSESGCE